MRKPIKVESIQKIPSDSIPYQNRWGYWVWRRPCDIPLSNWPGQKPPKWATGVIFDKCWCWTDE